MLEPLAIGNWILKADVSDERRMRMSSGSTGVNVARGRSRTKVATPSTMTAMMYQRARAGRSRSKSRQVYARDARYIGSDEPDIRIDEPEMVASSGSVRGGWG